MVKPALAVLALLVCSTVTRADSITTVAEDLSDNSVIPLVGHSAYIMADNLLTAQANAYYTAFEPDSLALSIDAVLRAIYLESTFGFDKVINSRLTPLPFEQSMIAIDDRVSVSITPSSINFGDVPVVSTPEPGSMWLLLAGLALLLLAKEMRRIPWRL